MRKFESDDIMILLQTKNPSTSSSIKPSTDLYGRGNIARFINGVRNKEEANVN